MKPHNNLVEELHFSLLMRVKRGPKTFNSFKEKKRVDKKMGFDICDHNESKVEPFENVGFFGP